MIANLNFLHQNGLTSNLYLVSKVVLDPVWSVANMATRLPMQVQPSYFVNLLNFVISFSMVSKKKKNAKAFVYINSMLVYVFNRVMIMMTCLSNFSRKL